MTAHHGRVYPLETGGNDFACEQAGTRDFAGAPTPDTRRDASGC